MKIKITITAAVFALTCFLSIQATEALLTSTPIENQKLEINEITSVDFLYPCPLEWQIPPRCVW